MENNAIYSKNIYILKIYSKNIYISYLRLKKNSKIYSKSVYIFSGKIKFKFLNFGIKQIIKIRNSLFMRFIDNRDV